MGQIIPVKKAFNPLFDARSVALIRASVCKECTDRQFDEFMYIARQKNLDPLMKQLHCIIINKGKLSPNGDPLEQMVPIVGIGGYRSLAARKGNYLPDDQPARLIKRKSAIDPDTNPIGLVSAVTYVKCFMHGEWHRIAGKAKWPEYAPLKDHWEYDPEQGRDCPTGRKILPKNNRWYLSPELMLEKCAESAALRRGWPDDYSGVWDEVEFDKHKVLELSPSEFARVGEQIERENRVGGPGIIVHFLEDSPLETIPAGVFADRVFAFIEANADKPMIVTAFKDMNKVSLNHFWTINKSDCLAIRRRIAEIEGNAPRGKTAKPMADSVKIRPDALSGIGKHE